MFGITAWRTSQKRRGIKMRCLRSKSIAIFGCAAAVIALLSAAPALAAGSHAAPTTRSAEIKAVLKSEIRAQLRYNPYGRVISSTEI